MYSVFPSLPANARLVAWVPTEMIPSGSPFKLNRASRRRDPVPAGAGRPGCSMSDGLILKEWIMATRSFRNSLLLLSVLLCGRALFGQTSTPATIVTYAGNDAIFAGGGQLATAAQLVGPKYVAVDGQGNVYLSASGLSMVLKVGSNGIISVVAGDGLSRYSGDGGLAEIGRA